MEEIKRKTLGYAQKNIGKTTDAYVWTRHGVVKCGVYTSSDGFDVRHIEGHCVDIKINFPELSGAVKTFLDSPFKDGLRMHNKIFGFKNG